MAEIRWQTATQQLKVSFVSPSCGWHFLAVRGWADASGDMPGNFLDASLHFQPHGLWSPSPLMSEGEWNYVRSWHALWVMNTLKTSLCWPWTATKTFTCCHLLESATWGCMWPEKVKRCVPGDLPIFSFCNILSKHKQTNQKLTQRWVRSWTQEQRWKSLYQHLYPLGRLISFSNLLVSSMKSPFLSPTGWW